MSNEMDFQHTLTIGEQWMDTMGHVNHAHYLSFCEQARWAWAASRQVGRDYIERTQIGWVILDANVRYLKEVRLGDQVTVSCKLISFKNKIGRIHHQIINQHLLLCAEVEVTFGFFDLRARKLVSPDAQLAAAWDIYAS
jgi:acyl-CoA thioester hydrolase